MEDLKNEVAILKNSILALTDVIKSASANIEILQQRIQEFEDRKIEVDPVSLRNIINRYFTTNAPSFVPFEWSDGGFTANYEIDFHDFMDDELGYQWMDKLAESIVEYIQDTNK